MVLYADARASNLRVLAELNNYAFDPNRDASIGQRYGTLTRLTQFQNCTASNVVRGSLGRFKFCAFDFVDLDRRRRSKGTRKFGPVSTSFAAVVVETDLELPAVIIE